MYIVSNLYTGSKDILGGAVSATTLRLNYGLSEKDDGFPLEDLPIGGTCLCVGSAPDSYVYSSYRKRRKVPPGTVSLDGHMIFMVERVS